MITDSWVQIPLPLLAWAATSPPASAFRSRVGRCAGPAGRCARRCRGPPAPVAWLPGSPGTRPTPGGGLRGLRGRSRKRNVTPPGLHLVVRCGLSPGGRSAAQQLLALRSAWGFAEAPSRGRPLLGRRFQLRACLLAPRAPSWTLQLRLSSPAMSHPGPGLRRARLQLRVQ